MYKKNIELNPSTRNELLGVVSTPDELRDLQRKAQSQNDRQREEISRALNMTLDAVVYDKNQDAYVVKKDDLSLLIRLNNQRVSLLKEFLTDDRFEMIRASAHDLQNKLLNTVNIHHASIEINPQGEWEVSIRGEGSLSLPVSNPLPNGIKRYPHFIVKLNADTPTHVAHDQTIDVPSFEWGYHKRVPFTEENKWVSLGVPSDFTVSQFAEMYVQQPMIPISPTPLKIANSILPNQSEGRYPVAAWKYKNIYLLKRGSESGLDTATLIYNPEEQAFKLGGGWPKGTTLKRNGNDLSIHYSSGQVRKIEWVVGNNERVIPSESFRLN